MDYPWSMFINVALGSATEDDKMFEGKEIASELKRFDPLMAQKFLAVVTALDDLAVYVRARGEFMTVPPQEG